MKKLHKCESTRKSGVSSIWGRVTNKLAAGLALATVAASSLSAHATVLEDLEADVTTNLGLIITSVGVILVAALALPIARKVYRVIKSAITGA